jgi:DNA-binding transcriptional regulator YdaS (Cro superfamily)
MEAIALMEYWKANRHERENVIKSRIALKSMRFLKISSPLVSQWLLQTDELRPERCLGQME